MTRSLTRRSRLHISLVTAAILFCGQHAGAETIPLPTIDYEAKANLLNEGTLHIRHGNGKMRIEMNMPQLGEPAVGFIDLKRKIMIMALPIPGVKDTAVEVGFGDDAAFGQVIGDGQRAGSDTVAGEQCTIWKVKSVSTGADAAACLTSDNIALRTQVMIDGKTTTVFEVTELKRQPQTPSELEAPSNLNVIKVPKGIKGIPGFQRP